MKVTSLRYLDAKFHHPSLGASPPNRGNRISCVQNSRKTENRNSVNNSGIGILCSKNSNERLAFPAVAGLLVPLYGWIGVGFKVGISFRYFYRFSSLFGFRFFQNIAVYLTFFWYLFPFFLLVILLPYTR